jgi:hypothetical protein
MIIGSKRKENIVKIWNNKIYLVETNMIIGNIKNNGMESTLLKISKEDIIAMVHGWVDHFQINRSYLI